MKKTVLRGLLALLCALVIAAFAIPGFAQDDTPRLDVAFSASTLGFGVQAARPLALRSDVRGGFSFYNYNKNFSKDGANYDGHLNLRSVNVQFDQYLVAGLHVSGGVLLWNGNKGDATVQVPGRQSFTLGGTTYFSDRNSPVHGAATLDFRNVAPMLLIGYGNLTSKGHIAYAVETGVAFQGAPRTTLSLSGNVCDITGILCQDIATTPAVQSRVVAQQAKNNDRLSRFRYYPILQVIIGYKF